MKGRRRKIRRNFGGTFVNRTRNKGHSFTVYLFPVGSSPDTHQQVLPILTDYQPRRTNSEGHFLVVKCG
jgi:hypothetical protein